MPVSRVGIAGDRWNSRIKRVVFVVSFRKFRKKSGTTALSGGCHPAGTGQRETLQLNRIRERKRQRMFRSEADFLTLRCEYSTSTGATADTCSDSCAFAAAGYGTDCGAKSCATGDDPSVT